MFLFYLVLLLDTILLQPLQGLALSPSDSFAILQDPAICAKFFSLRFLAGASVGCWDMDSLSPDLYISDSDVTGNAFNKDYGEAATG